MTTNSIGVDELLLSSFEGNSGTMYETVRTYCIIRNEIVLLFHKYNISFTESDRELYITPENLNKLISNDKAVYFINSSFEDPLQYTIKLIDSSLKRIIFISAIYDLDNDVYHLRSLITSVEDLEAFKEEYGILDYNKYIKDKNEVYIDWYLGKDGYGELIKSKIKLDVQHTLEDLYYPAISKKYNTSIKDFIDNFKNSEESVLILTGMKGSGKTELIRHISKQFNTNTTLTFNKEIMMSNDFYYKFFTSSTSDLMIIEDADTLLSKRSDGNPIMDLFLNLSDGLISSSKKKFIFTSNLPNLSTIDEALLRKGRCFATVQFEYLNAEESKLILESLSLNIEEFYDLNNVNQITIADIMAFKNSTLTSKVKVKQKGFGLLG